MLEQKATDQKSANEIRKQELRNQATELAIRKEELKIKSQQAINKEK